MAEFIALLRGINVGGHRKMPMAELRALAEELGWREPQTYIQSGNLLFGAPGTANRNREKLEKAIAAKFGFEVPVIVRAAADWAGYIANNPFADDEAVEEKMLHLLLAASSPPDDAIAKLSNLAKAGERVRQSGDAIWIDFHKSTARSKITPKAIDGEFGASATGRNLKTVRALQDLIENRTG